MKNNACVPFLGMLTLCESSGQSWKGLWCVCQHETRVPSLLYTHTPLAFVVCSPSPCPLCLEGAAVALREYESVFLSVVNNF